MERRWLLIVGGSLMAALGVVRGVGGLALLLRGPALDPNIRASAGATALLGGVLLVLGLLLVVAALGVFRGLCGYWRLGLIATAAFVVDGAINGLLLYGRLGAGGTVANLVAAVLIIAALLLGRSALRAPGRRHPPQG